MHYIGWKASRITFIAFIFAAVVIMILDAIKPINIPIRNIMSFFVAGFLLVYLISFKILEKYN
jgi:hypothetical protein